MLKALIGTLFAVVVGGGIYGLYVNYGTRAAMTQLSAKELLGNCALLQLEQYPSPEKIEAWLAAAKKTAPEIFAVNAVVGGAFNDNGQGVRTAIQVNSALQDCAIALQKKMPPRSAND